MKWFRNLSLFLLLVVMTVPSYSQQNEELSTVVYYKSEKGPLWNKHQLDSFLLTRTTKRARLVPKILSANQFHDTLVYTFMLVLDPVPSDESGKKLAGQLLPEFNFTDIDGKSASSKDLKGKPLVINFWFTACVPCIAEIPVLNSLKEKYKNSEVIFLSMTFEGKKNVLHFLKQHPFNFRIFANTKSYCDKTTHLYPLTLFVNKEGVIVSAKHIMPPLFNYETTKKINQLDPSEFEKNIELIK